MWTWGAAAVCRGVRCGRVAPGPRPPAPPVLTPPVLNIVSSASQVQSAEVVTSSPHDDSEMSIVKNKPVAWDVFNALSVPHA